MTDSVLAAVMPLSSYRQKHERIFQSEHSLQWFVRRHREELIKAGALVMLAGRWHAHEERFDQVVERAGQSAAQRHARTAVESAT